jgi:outer membrane protein TolC
MKKSWMFKIFSFYLLCITLATTGFGVTDPEQPDESEIRSEDVIKLTVEDAILLALENNQSLKVERINPLIQETYEEQERAEFDPLLSGEITGSKGKGRRVSTSGRIYENTVTRTDTDVSVSRFFPSGTRIGVDVTMNRLYSDLSPDEHSSRLGLTITQALLQGRGIDVNLATLRQARLDTEISEYELRGFTEALIAEVEKTYWDYYLAQRQADIYVESLKLSEQQLRETEERVRIGVLAEAEITAAQAEMALRREGLINARSVMEKTRLNLLRLLNPPGANFWNRKILLLDQPAVPEMKLDPVESHVAVALRMRAELNQARLGIQRGDLEIVKTKNGLLPKMDLFITFGKTGYAESFNRSLENLDNDYYDVSAGIKFELPIRNRSAHASYRQATLSRQQVQDALEKLAQLVEVDVRSIYIEVNRAKEQISATEATRKLQEEKLRIETEKYGVGRSTMFLVAQAQRDFVASQVSEVQSVVNYLKSLIELYRLEGSLLERRGILTSDNEPAGL